jgi:hypothetical protein
VRSCNKFAVSFDLQKEKEIVENLLQEKFRYFAASRAILSVSRAAARIFLA